MLDGETVFETAHPEARLCEAHVIAAKRDRFRYAQAMSVHHQPMQARAEYIGIARDRLAAVAKANCGARLH